MEPTEGEWDSAKPAAGDWVDLLSHAPDGSNLRFRMLWDDDNLYVFFHCVDKNVLATRTKRDSDVYRDDCVEVFASPEINRPENYFNNTPPKSEALNRH